MSTPSLIIPPIFSTPPPAKINSTPNTPLYFTVSSIAEDKDYNNDLLLINIDLDAITITSLLPTLPCYTPIHTLFETLQFYSRPPPLTARHTPLTALYRVDNSFASGHPLSIIERNHYIVHPFEIKHNRETTSYYHTPCSIATAIQIIDIFTAFNNEITNFSLYGRRKFLFRVFLPFLSTGVFANMFINPVHNDYDQIHTLIEQNISTILNVFVTLYSADRSLCTIMPNEQPGKRASQKSVEPSYRLQLTIRDAISEIETTYQHAFLLMPYLMTIVPRIPAIMKIQLQTLFITDYTSLASQTMIPPIDGDIDTRKQLIANIISFYSLTLKPIKSNTDVFIKYFDYKPFISQEMLFAVLYHDCFLPDYPIFISIVHEMLNTQILNGSEVTFLILIELMHKLKAYSILNPPVVPIVLPQPTPKPLARPRHGISLQERSQLRSQARRITHSEATSESSSSQSTSQSPSHPLSQPPQQLLLSPYDKAIIDIFFTFSSIIKRILPIARGPQPDLPNRIDETFASFCCKTLLPTLFSQRTIDAFALPSSPITFPYFIELCDMFSCFTFLPFEDSFAQPCVSSIISSIITYFDNINIFNIILTLPPDIISHISHIMTCILSNNRIVYENAIIDDKMILTLESEIDRTISRHNTDIENDINQYIASLPLTVLDPKKQDLITRYPDKYYDIDDPKLHTDAIKELSNERRQQLQQQDEAQFTINNFQPQSMDGINFEFANNVASNTLRLKNSVDAFFDQQMNPFRHFALNNDPDIQAFAQVAIDLLTTNRNEVTSMICDNSAKRVYTLLNPTLLPISCKTYQDIENELFDSFNNFSPNLLPSAPSTVQHIRSSNYQLVTSPGRTLQILSNSARDIINRINTIIPDIDSTIKTSLNIMGEQAKLANDHVLLQQIIIDAMNFQPQDSFQLDPNFIFPYTVDAIQYIIDTPLSIDPSLLILEQFTDADFALYDQETFQNIKNQRAVITKLDSNTTRILTAIATMKHYLSAVLLTKLLFVDDVNAFSQLKPTIIDILQSFNSIIALSATSIPIIGNNWIIPKTQLLGIVGAQKHSIPVLTLCNNKLTTLNTTINKIIFDNYGSADMSIFSILQFADEKISRFASSPRENSIFLSNVFNVCFDSSLLSVTFDALVARCTNQTVFDPISIDPLSLLHMISLHAFISFQTTARILNSEQYCKPTQFGDMKAAYEQLLQFDDVSKDALEIRTYLSRLWTPHIPTNLDVDFPRTRVRQQEIFEYKDIKNRTIESMCSFTIQLMDEYNKMNGLGGMFAVQEQNEKTRPKGLRAIHSPTNALLVMLNKLPLIIESAINYNFEMFVQLVDQHFHDHGYIFKFIFNIVNDYISANKLRFGDIDTSKANDDTIMFYVDIIGSIATIPSSITSRFIDNDTIGMFRSLIERLMDSFNDDIALVSSMTAIKFFGSKLERTIINCVKNNFIPPSFLKAFYHLSDGAFVRINKIIDEINNVDYQMARILENVINNNAAADELRAKSQQHRDLLTELQQRYQAKYREDYKGPLIDESMAGQFNSIDAEETKLINECAQQHKSTLIKLIDMQQRKQALINELLNMGNDYLITPRKLEGGWFNRMMSTLFGGGDDDNKMSKYMSKFIKICEKKKYC